MAKAKPLTLPMQRLVKALERHGDVDTIRDGGTIGTVVALMDRGILREATPRSHGKGSGHHYPATTPEQVWDEAHALNGMCCTLNPVGHARTECPANVDDWQDPEEGSGSMFIGAASGRLVNPEGTPAAVTALGGTFGGAIVTPADALPTPAQGPIRTGKRFAEMTMGELRTLVKRLGYSVERTATWNSLAVFAERAEAEGRVIQPEPETDEQRTGVSDAQASIAGEVAALVPRFPEGTPEYEAYATELKTELGKFAKGEEPYPYETTSDPIEALRGLIAAYMLFTRPPGANARDLAMAHLDRIAALVPQRATNQDGTPLWLHDCGATVRTAASPGTYECSGCGAVTGGWQALYTVAGR